MTIVDGFLFMFGKFLADLAIFGIVVVLWFAVMLFFYAWVKIAEWLKK